MRFAYYGTRVPDPLVLPEAARNTQHIIETRVVTEMDGLRLRLYDVTADTTLSVVQYAVVDESSFCFI